MGMSRVSNLKARAGLLMVGLLATLLVLALSACGGAGGQEKVKARPLPLYPTSNILRPGEYYSAKFKPSLSFRLGKGLTSAPPLLRDYIEIDGPSRGPSKSSRWIRFSNVKEVYKPGEVGAAVEAPKDLVGWFQHHPDLKTSEPKPVTVGGVKGEQLEVLVDHLPKDPNGYCGSDCLDIFNQSSNQIGYFREVNKRRVIVLEDVKGDTVVIWYAGPPDTFDKFAPRAQKVVDSVKWSG